MLDSCTTNPYTSVTVMTIYLVRQRGMGLQTAWHTPVPLRQRPDRGIWSTRHPDTHTAGTQLLTFHRR